MNMFSNRLHISIVLILLISACSLPDNKDTFYTATRDGDLYRFPVLKPIEVFSTTDFRGTDWFVSLPYINDFSKSQVKIDSIGVVDSLVIAYNSLIYLPGEMTTVWITIDIRNNYIDVEKTISKELRSKLTLYAPDDVYSSFLETGKTPW